MDDEDERQLAVPTAHYPRAEITPAEFESFVAELLEGATDQVDHLQVQLHEQVLGADGAYEIDATVRFDLGGMAFLVLVEAKRHTNPIKRELVQVLHQKVQSVGAHKGALISTAPFQRGALKYAKAHGIALATVTEGRFTFETKAAAPSPPLSREEALDRYGIPAFVAHVYSPGQSPGSTKVTLVGTERIEYLVEQLFGVEQEL